MKESRIISTIVLAVFVALFMFVTINLLRVNLAEVIQQMLESVEGAEQTEGEGILVYIFLALFIGGFGAIFFYVLAVIILINSLILGLLAIRNRKSTNKWVRYFNYFLAVCCLFMLVSSIVKMILWRCGY